MELVGTVGGHDQDAFGTQAAGEEVQDVAGRSVGPVQVLHDDHDRPQLGEPAEEREQALEHPGLRPFGPARAGLVDDVSELRHESPELARRLVEERVGGLRSELPDQAVERLRDRGEGQSLVAAKADAGAVEDERVDHGRARRELGKEARLADARLAADKHDRRGPAGRALGRLVEDQELLLAPDADRTRDATGHVPDHRPVPVAPRRRAASTWPSERRRWPTPALASALRRRRAARQLARPPRRSRDAVRGRAPRTSPAGRRHRR